MNRYGPDCTLTCTCASSTQCSARTGCCHCHRGSMGSSCREGEPSPVLCRPRVLPAAQGLSAVPSPPAVPAQVPTRSPALQGMEHYVLPQPQGTAQLHKPAGGLVPKALE